MDCVHRMCCIFPLGAGTLSDAGGPRGPKPFGGRRPLHHCADSGVVGGEKYSSLELNAIATAGVTAFTVWLGCDGNEAELSDEARAVGHARCFYNITTLTYIIFHATQISFKLMQIKSLSIFLHFQTKQLVAASTG